MPCGRSGPNTAAAIARRPTRLGDWDVRSLYAHAAVWPSYLSVLADRVRDTEPTHATTADVLRHFNAPDGVADVSRDMVAGRAREDAAKYSTAQMVEQFSDTGPRAITVARQLGPVVVDYFGLALVRLEEAAGIGVLEGTVHLLDLQRALGQAPD